MTRNELLSGILHGVGLPLIGSIIHVSTHKKDIDAEAQLTLLLSMTIESSEAVRDHLDISEEEVDDLQLRTHLLSFASQIISIHYRESQSTPTHNELKRSVSSVSVLQAFSDEYLPPASLTQLYPENQDGKNPTLQMIHTVSYLESFTPLVNAIGSFAFGHTHTKMMQDVSTKLRERASEITTHIVSPLSPVSEKRETELSILKALISIYVSCHEQETQRILALPPETRNTESSEQQVGNIWTLFEQRITILFTLLDNVLPPNEEEDVDDFSDMDFEAHSFEPIEEQKPSPLTFYRKESDES